MNVDDLIQYVSQETLLIGFKLKTRAFLLIGLRHIAKTFQNTRFVIRKPCIRRELLSLYQIIPILKYSFYWNEGLKGACLGGHQDLAEWVILKGADDLNRPLTQACLKGHRDLIAWLISKGFNDWNSGLYGACKGGYKDLVKLMISKGATFCNHCSKTMNGHLI